MHQLIIKHCLFVLTLFQLAFEINAQTTTLTYTHTGASQSFTVPACVYNLTVDVRGAQGGQAMDNTPSNGPGGLGGRSIGVLTVTPGQVIQLMVGGRGFTTGVGGFNGGGTGGTSTAGSSCFGGPAGGGGGASDIRTGLYTLTDRVIVAGGGGGAGRDYCNGTCQPCGCGGNGGCGGGIYGSQGFSSFCSENPTTYTSLVNMGAGGTPTAGGTGGPGDIWSTSVNSNPGTSGTLGQGGNGGNGNFDIAGGGGGGGYYGGGGGGGAGSGSGVGAGGGGGGSAYLGGVSSGVTSSCYQNGDGLIIISYVLGGAPLALNISSSTLCSGSSATITGLSQTTYTWSTGSNASSIIVTPSVTTSYSATATNSSGCTSTAALVITIDNSAPTLSVSVTSMSVCPGQTVIINASGAPNYSITGSAIINQPFVPTSSGSYALTSYNACGSASAIVSIMIYSVPVINVVSSTPTICLGNSVTFTASGAPQINWSNGVFNGVPVSPLSNSVFTVTGTSAQGCTNTALGSVTVVPFAGSSITATPGNTAVCLGTVINYAANGASSYTWNTGANTSAITITPAVSGIYSVTGTNSLGCISSLNMSVTVNSASPQLSVSASTLAICAGQTVVITASGASTYTFSGGVINGQPFSPGSTNTYSITGANACGSATGLLNIAVNPIPQFTAAPTSFSVCSGHSVATLAGGNAISYVVSNGVPINQVFYPIFGSTYTVTGLSVWGCSAAVVITLQVVQNPTLNTTISPTLICLGNSSTLSAGGASSFTWLPGGSNNSVLVVSPVSMSTYTLLRSNSNCVSTNIYSVFVNQLPVINAFATPSIICPSTSATLTGTGGLSYLWTGPSGNISLNTTATVNPVVNTVYTLSASDGTCSNTATVSINMNPSPTLNVIASATSVCQNNSTTLTASGANSYSWSPPGASGSVIVISPTATALYNITGTNSFGCSSSTQIAIVTKPNPTVQITSPNLTICNGDNATLTASGALNYSWSTGSVTNTTVVSPTTTSQYTCLGTGINGCTMSTVHTVQVYSPQLSVNPSSANICIGQPAILSANGANTYTWSNGALFPNISVNPTTTTVYTVSANSFTSGLSCKSSQTVAVSVQPNPVVTAVSSQSQVCRSSTLTLTANGASTYTWSNGSTSNPQVITATTLSNFTVTGTDANGCVNTATLTFKISTCTGIENFEKSQSLFEIYPNPSNGNFTIRSPENINLLLTDEGGKLVGLIQLNENNGREYKIENLANGIYYIYTEKQQSRISEKIIVDK